MKLSVIIPTHNRKGLLEKVIQNYLDQTLDSALYEIIIVDDASTDGSQAMVRQRFADRVTYIRQEKLGPAAARNIGIAEAKGEYLFFTNDDMYPEPDLLARHVAAHESQGAKGGILGYVKWADGLKVNPFMHYVTEVGGGQFSYFRIKDVDNVPWQYFYTCNISLASEWLAKEMFASDLEYPILEDIELGYRLSKQGFTLKFLKDAIVYHDHAIDYQHFLQRQYQAGQIAVYLAEKYPDLTQVLGVERGNAVELNMDVLQFSDELRIMLEKQLKSQEFETFFGLEKLRKALHQCYSILVGASYYQGVKDYQKSD